MAVRTRTSHTGLSETVEDYIRAIDTLHAEDDGPFVPTGRLAARLRVSPASASAMIKKLAQLGLAEHAPYKGVALTEGGERVALELMRHHRLLELFLAEHLDVPADQVHAEADRLAPVLSEELEARMAAKLRHPTHDRNGAPIPTSTLALAADVTVSLADLAAGGAGRVARVLDTNPEIVAYLRELGVNVGVRVEVLDRQPFAGPVTLRAQDRDVILGDPMIHAIRIELDAPAAAATPQ